MTSAVALKFGKGADTGYESPPDLQQAQDQVRQWIAMVGLPEATERVCVWMRVPARPVPHFLLRPHVRAWLKWLLDHRLTLGCAEFRCLWYSFRREVLPGLAEMKSVAEVVPSIADTGPALEEASPAIDGRSDQLADRDHQVEAAEEPEEKPQAQEESPDDEGTMDLFEGLFDG